MKKASGGPRPNQGGPAESLGTERASATPLAARPAGSAPASHESGAQAGIDIEGGVEGPLRSLQDWFLEVITTPESVEAGISRAQPIQRALNAPNLEALVTPSDRLSVPQRMQLYHYAYHARLIDCLIDDYPTVQYALGEETFERLAKAYIEAHPSNHPNLNHFGRHLPKFCRTLAERSDARFRNAEFLADLAQLEWSMVEVIHAGEAPTLGMLALQEMDPQQWAGIKLPPSPMLHFHEFRYPVNRFLQDYREDRAPKIPEPSWSSVAIYREGFKVWRMTHTRPMAQVLKGLLEGETLGEALGRLAQFESTEDDVMVWFKEWVSGGFFSRIEI